MLEPNVFPQPKFWRYMPFLSRHYGTTILNRIYLRRDIYENLKAKNPKPENVGVLLHEQEHVKRRKTQGNIKFVKYLFSGKFRFHEELEASKPQLKVLKQNNISVDLDQKAKTMSGWIYLWPVSFKFAKKELKKAWESV